MDAGDAPGWPGIEPRWTSSAKSGVGTSLSPVSRVWFTLSHGILNEVYYPRVDHACIRDFGLIVTDGTPGGFFAEEKRDTDSRIATMADGVPAYRMVNTDPGGRFVIDKCVLADPRHEVVLQHVVFTARTPGLRLFALVSPHLYNAGAHNTGWVDDYKGEQMLFAEGKGRALAVACSTGWAGRSVGFVAHSDGWQILRQHGFLADQFSRAADGNVALCGEIELGQGTQFVLALSFGASWSEAAFRARASLMRPFPVVQEEYIGAWRSWQAGLRLLRGASETHDTFAISTAVLRTHDPVSFPGGIIASLSIPWGFSKGDDDLGGYHLVWPRDLVETAGGLLAAGARADARRVLDYLRTIQEPSGGWPQNCWLDGVPFWKGLQLDECAFPILLVDMARREDALPEREVMQFWPMVRAALGFVLHIGPVTMQDRWEEDGGYSPFTLAVVIAALVVGADLADAAGEPALAALCRDTADAWNDAIDAWCYVRGTKHDRDASVEGHYVRISPARDGTGEADPTGTVSIRNRPEAETQWPAADIVSPDALALVRFGLRAADDPRMVSTVAVIDRVLRRELPAGPCWYRYNADGYGEHADGHPFDGTGIGRLWPLLTGERAHYELAAGRAEQAKRLLATLEGLTSDGFLIPEQVWDADDIVDRELVRGKPSGSAMPLVWAHAEHIKLCRSLADGAVFDLPPQTVARYLRASPAPRVQPWRADWRPKTVADGRVLRLDLVAPAEVAWSSDGWATSHTVHTADSGVGLFVAEIPCQALPVGTKVMFRAGAVEGEVAVG